jgi:hypothetical protein
MAYAAKYAGLFSQCLRLFPTVKPKPQNTVDYDNIVIILAILYHIVAK